MPPRRRRTNTARPRPAPRPPVKIKPGDERFAICSASGFPGVHGPIGLEISYSGPKRRPTTLCPICKSRTFFGPKVKPGVGLTREQVKGYGALLLDELGA